MDKQTDGLTGTQAEMLEKEDKIRLDDKIMLRAIVCLPKALFTIDSVSLRPLSPPPLPSS